MKGNRMDSNIVSPSNNNILLNANFANLINQRNWICSLNDIIDFPTYGYDRWAVIAPDGGMSIGSSAGYSIIRVTSGVQPCHIFQPLEDPESYFDIKLAISFEYKIFKDNNNIVFSLDCYRDRESATDQHNLLLPIALGKDLIKDNEWHIYNKIITVPRVVFHYIEFNISIGNFNINSYDAIPMPDIITEDTISNEVSFGLRWIKMELGEECTPYISRSWEEELRLCRKYYEIIGLTGGIFGVTNNLASNSFDVNIVPKRSSPTISFNNIKCESFNIKTKEKISSKVINITGIPATSDYSRMHLIFSCESDSNTESSSEVCNYFLLSGNSFSYIEFDSEIGF